MAGLTPMMRQYFEIKEQAKDCILFFRLGDFYEMFQNDALEAVEILGITLTARSKGEDKIPMCGIPYHSAAGYIAKLTRAGKKVAICEQTSDPSLPGIVKREIVRVITPGTTLDENVLDEKSSNFLAAIWSKTVGYVVAMVEMSTGEFLTFEANGESLLAEFSKYKPREILVSGENFDQSQLAKWQKFYPGAFWHQEKLSENWNEKIVKQFGEETTMSAESGKAAGLIIGFLESTQRTEAGGEKLAHLKEIEVRQSNQLMQLDEATIRNLEILENAREKKVDGSLLSILDKTVTSAGGRMMKKVLVEPLLELTKIEERLAAQDFLLRKQQVILDLREKLKVILDLERMLGRLNLGSGNARDLRGIVNSLKWAAEVKKYLGQVDETGKMAYGIDNCELLVAELDEAVVEEAPFGIREGGMIKDGYDSELDEYRNLSRDGKSFIAALQAREIERSGINSLKVKFNQIFGYYIEISNANLAQVPADYTRKQTLANAERFTTPELKEYEEKVLTAEEKIVAIETVLFEKLRQKVLAFTANIKQTAACLAYLDVQVSLALVSWENRYVRPKISKKYRLEIIGGRHPVIEKLNVQDKFIPNDTVLDQGQRMVLITGPNMGGKSTFLRQTALIVLMAHLGMYVPAERAEIALVDRIFTRVGASDNLVRGQSTFWLEMEETAGILSEATERSLIVLDEIGRGTSTFDGVSIAWGIMEYLHNSVGAKTLFASHYHELINLADELSAAANFSVKVEETVEDGVVFLYKIGAGGIDRSYGIEVAKLAGLPSAVINRAKEILSELEKEEIGHQQTIMPLEAKAEPIREHQGLKKLRELDLNNLTPLEALNQLNILKKSLDE